MKKFLRVSLTIILTVAISPFEGLTGSASANETHLTVALYPYVPRFEQFQTAIQTEWDKVQPGVTLNFLPSSEWDGGYSDNPPANVDVYVFDGMFFDYFLSQKWLEAMQASEISNLNDFVGYAIEGVKVGEQYYALPQLGCANILFYEKNDGELAKATKLSEINSTLSQCTYTSEIPPDQRGLMLDMSGGTTNAALYLDTAHSITGQYPFPLPQDQSQINPAAMKNMRELLAMASYENGTTSVSQDYERGTWFSKGWGRALIGFTEHMSVMSPETRQNIGFKVMPLSDIDNAPLFYADVVGVNTTTNQRGTRTLAVQLANVIAASNTMIASIGPDNSNPYPQYLMATRPSVFQALWQTFPLYKEMYALITNDDPIMFKVDSESREWLASMKSTITSDARQNYACGCDQPAALPISDNTAATAICNTTCKNNGGWNGQWTNAYPAAQDGSVCGCNSCPVSSN